MRISKCCYYFIHWENYFLVRKIICLCLCQNTIIFKDLCKVECRSIPASLRFSKYSPWSTLIFEGLQFDFFKDNTEC